MTIVVLLAAGRGVRMRSERPKVLHEAAGRTLLDRVLETAKAARTASPVPRGGSWIAIFTRG